MKIYPSILRRLPNEEHALFERHATEIVCESFIFTGDRDYLTARFAFFQRHPHLFLWSAAQALENYLRANILVFGSGVATNTQGHENLGNELRRIRPERLNIELGMPPGWAEQGVVHWHDLNAHGFLQRLEKLASPALRHEQFPLEIHLQDLVLLDRLVFSLREQLVDENVVNCKLVGEEFKQCFFDLNYPFCPSGQKHPHLTEVRPLHTTVTTLEDAVKGAYGHGAVYQAWAQQSMRMKPKYLQRILDGANKAVPS